MDPTSIVYGALIVLGVLGIDIVAHPSNVIVYATAPPKMETTAITQAAVDSQFDALISDIAATKSLVNAPELFLNTEPGVGMSVASALGAEKVAYALQNELGAAQDYLSLDFYVEEGIIRGLVSGYTHFGVKFGQVLTIDKGETFMAFMRRCSLRGISQIAPYTTAVYLMGAHSGDKNFTDVIALAERTKALLPPTPNNLDSSLLDNLLGLIALFKNDPKSAQTAFATAMADDPTNPLPFINASFADLQLNDYQSAANRMEQLMRLAPPSNQLLVASAYMTWAAALMGLHQLDGADRLLAAATAADPDSSVAFGLWAEEKRLEGDQEAADYLKRKALEKSGTFENYAEVAALYFHLAWQDNRPAALNTFPDAKITSFD